MIWIIADSSAPSLDTSHFLHAYFWSAIYAAELKCSTVQVCHVEFCLHVSLSPTRGQHETSFFCTLHLCPYDVDLKYLVLIYDLLGVLYTNRSTVVSLFGG